MSFKQAQTAASSVFRAMGEAMAVKEQPLVRIPIKSVGDCPPSNPMLFVKIGTTSFISLVAGALIAKYGAWYMDQNDMWKKSDDDDDDDDDD